MIFENPDISPVKNKIYKREIAQSLLEIPYI